MMFMMQIFAGMPAGVRKCSMNLHPTGSMGVVNHQRIAIYTVKANVLNYVPLRTDFISRGCP